MANSLTTNPIVLDTIGSTSIMQAPFSYRAIRYVGATGTGHSYVIKDAKGINVIAWDKVNANIIGQYTPTSPINCTDGMQLTFLDSGKVYIYT